VSGDELCWLDGFGRVEGVLLAKGADLDAAVGSWRVTSHRPDDGREGHATVITQAAK